MKTIVFAASKGGTGKSTLCFNVAIEASRRHQVFLADLDPQQSLKRMWDTRNDMINPRLVTKVTDLGQSVKLLTEAGYDREYMFVDTPGSFLDHIARTAAAADLIVAPVQPSPVDWRAQMDLCEKIVEMGMRHRLLVVVNKAETKSDLVERTKGFFEMYSDFEVEVVKDRVDYKKGAEVGKAAFEVGGNKDAAKEIRVLWDAIKNALATASAKKEATVHDRKQIH